MQKKVLSMSQRAMHWLVNIIKDKTAIVEKSNWKEKKSNTLEMANKQNLVILKLRCNKSTEMEKKFDGNLLQFFGLLICLYINPNMQNKIQLITLWYFKLQEKKKNDNQVYQYYGRSWEGETNVKKNETEKDKPSQWQEETTIPLLVLFVPDFSDVGSALAPWDKVSTWIVIAKIRHKTMLQPKNILNIAEYE